MLIEKDTGVIRARLGGTASKKTSGLSQQDALSRNKNGERK